MKANTAIEIVGAGTSGLASAYLFSKTQSSREIVVYEKANSYGARYGNSIQSLRNYENSEDVLNYLEERSFYLPDRLFYPIHKQIRIFPDGTKLEISSSNPAFYNLLRGNSNNSLDSFLFNESKSQGVIFKFNSPYKEKFPDSKFVVSSRGSSLVKSAPFKIKGIEYQGISQNYPDNTIVIYFNQKLSPGGYIAILPFRKKGSDYMNITLAVGWDMLFKQSYSIDKILLLLKETDSPISQYLRGFQVKKTVSVFARAGFIKMPKKNTIYIGEEFGGLDSALFYGNLNSFKSAYAAYRAYETARIGNYMKYIRASSMIDDSLLGIARRIRMRKMTNDDYNERGNKLVNQFGDMIDYETYLSSKTKLNLRGRLKRTFLKKYIYMRYLKKV